MFANKNINLALRHAVNGTVLLALSACSMNPLVRWEDPKSTGAEAGTLEYGKAFSAAARKAYQKKSDDEISSTNQVSTAMIMLAGGIGLLAAGKAHRDAILGTALIGGTAYSVGNFNADRSRLQVHSDAIKLLDCADATATPFGATQGEVKELEKLLAELDIRIPAAEDATDKTQSALSQWVAAVPAASPLAGPYNNAIAASRNAINASRSARDSGGALLKQQKHASDNLINQVRFIDSKANDVLKGSAKDFKDVKDAIANIYAGAGLLAPGSTVQADLEGYVKNSLVPRTPAGQNQALGATTPPPSLVMAADGMADSVGRLRASAGSVQAQVDRASQAAGTASKSPSCETATIFTLSATPSRLSVPVGVTGTYTVTLNGGVASFQAKPNGPGLAGVAVLPIDLKSRDMLVSVSAAATRTGVANYIISDSSDPQIRLPFVIEVVGASEPAKPPVVVVAAVPRPRASAVPGTTPGNSTPAVTPTATAAPADVQAALPELRQIRSLDLPGMKVSVTSPPGWRAEGHVSITVACTPAPVVAACIKQEDLQALFKAKLPAAHAPVSGKLKFLNSAGKQCACQ